MRLPGAFWHSISTSGDSDWPVAASIFGCTPAADSASVSSVMDRSAPPREISARSIIMAVFIIGADYIIILPDLATSFGKSRMVFSLDFVLH